ncbi:MAG TPA: hypothetical protein VFM31_02895 [Nitrososphaeraceae archaeon]|jgi:hypothetical protein|nr:hypothetical protein [Nitrososphaeraceae archaeon]
MQYTEVETPSTFFNREKPDGTGQSILRIELNRLTITIRVLKMNVIYSMFITGYNSFSMYNDTIYKNDFIINLQEEVNKILN